MKTFTIKRFSDLKPKDLFRYCGQIRQMVSGNDFGGCRFNVLDKDRNLRYQANFPVAPKEYVAIYPND